MKRVDVAIIGGSLAGAACVRELTRQGIDAVAFERDRFPREKVCGGFLSPGAVDLLDELGTLDAVRAAGATTVRASTIHIRKREIRVALPRPGLGVSRSALDSVLAKHPGVQHGAVSGVGQEGEGFKIELDGMELAARVVVDAAGKLSRFTRRRAVPQFGVQFYGTGSCGDVLDFWFFDEGYGGEVSVEAGRTNACFLINKVALRGVLGRLRSRSPEGCKDNSQGWSEATPLERSHKNERTSKRCEELFDSFGFLVGAPETVLVTGPLSYHRMPSDFIAIGDAAGMIDPFCGEGMRHALDTGICAAKVIATGLRRGERYATMRARYEAEAAKRWRGKRALGRFIRHMLQYPRITSLGLHLTPEFWFRQLWA